MEPIPEQGRSDAVVRAVSFAAERFLTAESWRDCIDEVLKRLGCAAEVGRVYVYENHRGIDGRLLMSIRHEWHAPAIAPASARPENQSFPYRPGFERWESELHAGSTIQGLLREFPGPERAAMESMDIVSLVLVPIFTGQDWWGFMGFDECSRERTWLPAEVDALRAAAGTLGAAIRREHTDEQLREAEAKYRAIVEQLPVAIYIDAADSESTSVYVSPQIEQIAGTRPEEHYADPNLWIGMIHPADRERWRAESARVMADRDSFALEYRIVSRDGQVKWLHDEAHLERDEMNRPRYWRGVISDVTERKRVEQALADSEELHRGVVEMSPDAIFVGVEGRFEFVNAAMVRLLGASDPSELLGRAVMDFVHPDYHELVRDKMIAVKQGAEAPIASEKYVRLDGTEVDVEVAAIALTYRGKPAGLVLARDVTERGRTEEQLRQAEAKYRALVEQLPAIVYMAEFEEAGDWLYVSPQIESILGFTPQEWTADPTLFDQRIHPDDEAQYRADEARSRTSGGPLSSEYRMVARDGREVWIRDEAFVVRDDSGRPLLHQGVMFDVTQNKLAEQALRDGLEREHEASERLRSLDEMRNAFLHAVSHELRTPLTSVMGFALTLSRKDVTISDADRADMLDRLAANARKLERLLSDLLDVDRLARGILEPKLYPTDVAELARRVVSETEVGRRDVRIEGTARAHVDGPKVERILENLLVNSARHTPEGSTVWVRLSQTDDGVQIAVDDDGPGVPDALKQDIFEPFHQGQSSNTHAPGTGIGLSLVARFAELHGGRAWVEDRPGGGASFRVSIPSGDLGTVEPQPLRPAPEVDEDAVPRRERGVA